MNTYIKGYPRPQFVRGNWMELNGSWGFKFDDGKLGEKEQWYEEFGHSLNILVPFTYETKLSGIQDEAAHHCVWYQRNFFVDEESLNCHKLMLHFEGSDFVTKVWINGKYAGGHKGGYTRFSFNITNIAKRGENKITVMVEDYMNPQQPRGKQRWIKESFECWYIQTTGIWKTVWLETVPDVSLSSVKMTPLLSERKVQIECTVDGVDKEFMHQWNVEAVVSFAGEFIAKSVTSIMKTPTVAVIDLDLVQAGKPWGIHTWTPEKPELYDVCFRLLRGELVYDEVDSYFGMRDIKIEGSNILLNGKPLYQRLILDQGYWEESHLTPPNEAALIEDIDKIHALGYNGVRKHQKTEDERFLYWCDVKGMLVWCEAPATYAYSDEAVELFGREWLEIVRQNYNHPSIITWTPFNESWGIPEVKTNKTQQHFTEAIYHLTKSIDPFRPVVSNDGWEHTVSDIITLHDYEEYGMLLKERYTTCKDEIMNAEVYHSGYKSAFANGYTYRGQPIIISEFGGIAFDGEEKGWGYGNKVNTSEEFLERFDCITTAVKEIPYVCGYCYTQVTDVQQEVNGLMTIKRRFKINPNKIKEINEREVGFLRKIL